MNDENKLQYRGAHVDEVPAEARSIEGVPTSITAFIGRGLKGPLDHPVHLQSFSDCEEEFGGLRLESTMSYAVYQFFLNGGTDALIVRVETRDGSAVGFDEIANPNLRAEQKGLWALDKADFFNLLCIPPFDSETDVTRETWTAALAYCKERRAMLIVDPPSSWRSPSDLAAAIDGKSPPLGARDSNAAIYFPRVKIPDRQQNDEFQTFAPCGAVAGIYARTDANHGVWKAPAGQEAKLLGVAGLDYLMNDGEAGNLKSLGVNCLRRLQDNFVLEGARTKPGANEQASDGECVPVRRVALFIEESLYRGLQWVVFEPNGEDLWARIRLSVGAFLHNLFRQGAFQGVKAREAYFVKCDRETTTQNDIDLGIANIWVGFAPLKPAEFVMIRIQQKAGHEA
jgi:phage tail sheath protein FI